VAAGYAGTCQLLAPSTLAASSIEHQWKKTDLADLTRNGAETKTWAMITAVVEKGRLIPNVFNHHRAIPPSGH
jgi:hypothetical protein